MVLYYCIAALAIVVGCLSHKDLVNQRFSVEWREELTAEALIVQLEWLQQWSNYIWNHNTNR